MRACVQTAASQPSASFKTAGCASTRRSSIGKDRPGRDSFTIHTQYAPEASAASILLMSGRRAGFGRSEVALADVDMGVGRDFVDLAAHGLGGELVGDARFGLFEGYGVARFDHDDVVPEAGVDGIAHMTDGQRLD